MERYADTLIESDMRTALLVLMTATGLVLLIGCANLANLALARGVSRGREVAVRASLGAGRGRLVRQFLTENVMLSLCGGSLGIAVGYGAMRWLQLLVPPFSFAREVQITMDGRVLLFALAISVVTGLLFGIVPAWQATSPEFTIVMKDGGRGSTDHVSRKRLRDMLIVAEVALAFVLLVGSGLMMRSFFRLLNVDTGFDSSNVLTVGLPVATRRLPDANRLNLYLQEIRTAVNAVPGVRETAWSCAPPMQGACYGMPMQVASRPIVDRANHRLQSVLLGIFATVALLLAGGGIYGVIAYSVAQRTQEIGIRAALGASDTSLLQLILGRGVILTLVGLLIGVAGSLALTRLMGSLLYGVDARDPATMVFVATVLALVAVTACYVPARRATKIDPLAALRYD